MIQLEERSPFTDVLEAALEAGASVPLGKSGLVHVWGKNDMTSSQVMIIAWVVKDPTGLTVESYGDDGGTIGAGQTHEFIGGRFNINKTGNWTIAISLFMNRPAPVLVASWAGVLCAVTEEYKGSIFKKELEYDSVRGTIPVL